MNKIEFTAFIDRIEEDKAVVLVREEGIQVVWPLEYLPKDAREGCAIRISIRLDDEATHHNEEIVDSLIDRLQRGD